LFVSATILVNKVEYIKHGMTNYRIGTHRHTSTRIGAEFDRIDTAKIGAAWAGV